MKTKLPYLCILAGAALWGSIGIFVRVLSGMGFSSMQLIAVRAYITAAVLVVFLFVRDRFARDGKKLLRVRLRDCWCFVGTGILSVVFFNYCYFATISQCSLSVAAVLLYTAPSFVLLLSILLFKERMSARKGMALLLALCGLRPGLRPGPGGTARLPHRYPHRSGFRPGIRSVQHLRQVRSGALFSHHCHGLYLCLCQPRHHAPVRRLPIPRARLRPARFPPLDDRPGSAVQRPALSALYQRPVQNRAGQGLHSCLGGTCGGNASGHPGLWRAPDPARPAGCGRSLCLSRYPQPALKGPDLLSLHWRKPKGIAGSNSFTQSGTLRSFCASPYSFGQVLRGNMPWARVHPRRDHFRRPLRGPFSGDITRAFLPHSSGRIPIACPKKTKGALLMALLFLLLPSVLRPSSPGPCAP